MPYPNDPLFQPTGPDPLEQALAQLRQMAQTRGSGTSPIDLGARLPGGLPSPGLIGADPNAPERLELISTLQTKYPSKFPRGVDWGRYTLEDLQRLFDELGAQELRRQEQLEGLRKIDEQNKLRYLQGR